MVSSVLRPRYTWNLSWSCHTLSAQFVFRNWFFSSGKRFLDEILSFLDEISSLFNLHVSAPLFNFVKLFLRKSLITRFLDLDLRVFEQVNHDYVFHTFAPFRDAHVLEDLMDVFNSRRARWFRTCRRALLLLLWIFQTKIEFSVEFSLLFLIGCVGAALDLLCRCGGRSALRTRLTRGLLENSGQLL